MGERSGLREDFGEEIGETIAHTIIVIFKSKSSLPLMTANTTGINEFGYSVKSGDDTFQANDEEVAHIWMYKLI